MYCTQPYSGRSDATPALYYRGDRQAGREAASQAGRVSHSLWVLGVGVTPDLDQTRPDHSVLGSGEASHTHLHLSGRPSRGVAACHGNNPPLVTVYFGYLRKPHQALCPEMMIITNVKRATDEEKRDVTMTVVLPR